MMISATPRRDKLVILGDFNARVGTDHQKEWYVQSGMFTRRSGMFYLKEWYVQRVKASATAMVYCEVC